MFLLNCLKILQKNSVWITPLVQVSTCVYIMEVAFDSIIIIII